jgi:tRNA threonylcarbamoyladenosine biosynthesis protein TsaE
LSWNLSLPDLPATEKLAGELARILPDDLAGWTILLQGELGSGKSALARAMLRELGHVGAVPSPTYTLIEPYTLARKIIYHIDLYRISDSEELDFLGWSDLEDGLRLIEWPERVPSLLGQADVLIGLRYNGNGRAAELTAMSDRGEQLLGRLGLPTASYSS